MSLCFFPRRQPANAVRPKPPFALLDEVRVPGHADPRVVVALREPKPGNHEVCVMDAAGLEAWYAATILRPAHFGLRVIAGGLG